MMKLFTSLQAWGTSGRSVSASFESLESRQLMAATVFTIDPLRSVITARGSTETPLGVIQLSQQGAGSLSTSYQGTLVADITANSVTLEDASSIVANNSGNWAPKSPPPQPPTPAGSAPANYGAQVTVPFFGGGVVAVRNLAFSLAADATNLNPDGTFESGGQRFTALSGRGDYYETFSNSSGTQEVSGTVEQGQSAPASVYKIENGVPTLIIPVDINVTFRVFSQTEDDTEFHLTGQIVAKAAPAASSVVGRHVFYNASTYDGNSAALNAADDGAVAPDKSPILPGQTSAGSAVTNYSKGINGVMVDVANLPANYAPNLADFEFRAGNTSNPGEWAAAPSPSSIELRRGKGDSNADRVSLAWGTNAVKNQWLQVTVKANANTGLTAPDVFYLGNLIGETGDSTPAPVVNATDLLRVRNTVGGAGTTITTPTDIDKNGTVSAADLVLTRNNIGRSLKVFKAPAAGSATLASGSRPAFLVTPSALFVSRRSDVGGDEIDLLA